MSKRFTDSEKWSDPWFFSLPFKYKLFWIYMLDQCDNVGIYKLNKKLAQFQLGFQIDLKKITELFKDRIQLIDSEKILIKKFAEFQYGSFRNSTNPFHKKLSSIIDSISDTVSTGCRESVDTLQDKDKDKYININKGEYEGEKGEDKRKKNIFIKPTLEEVKIYFKENNYPEKLAETFFKSYDVANWNDSKGNSVKNWKQKAINVWFKEEHQIKQQSKSNNNNNGIPSREEAEQTLREEGLLNGR